MGVGGTSVDRRYMEVLKCSEETELHQDFLRVLFGQGSLPNKLYNLPRIFLKILISPS